MNKIFNKLMIIDASFMMHRNLKVKELWDLKNSKNIRTGGVFGFLRSLNYALNSEYFPILCWDSGLSPRRLEIYPDYKSNLSRSKSHAIEELAIKIVNDPSQAQSVEYTGDDLLELKSKIQEVMDNRKTYGKSYSDEDYLYQYRTQRSMVIGICNSLGIPSIKIEGWEGDDLMAILSRMSMRSIIVTDDKDLIQLISPSTDINRIVQHQYLKYDEYLPTNGLLSSRELIITKAIEGDGSDNIPSVTSGLERKYCVGGITAAKIAHIIIECHENPEEYIPVLNEIQGRDHNKIQGFIQRHDHFIRNMQLVDLSLVDNDSNVVDAIVGEIHARTNTTNLMTTLSKLGELEIVNFDVNSAISKILMSSKNALL